MSIALVSLSSFCKAKNRSAMVKASERFRTPAAPFGFSGQPETSTNATYGLPFTVCEPAKSGVSRILHDGSPAKPESPLLPSLDVDIASDDGLAGLADAALRNRIAVGPLAGQRTMRLRWSLMWRLSASDYPPPRFSATALVSHGPHTHRLRPTGPLCSNAYDVSSSLAGETHGPRRRHRAIHRST